MACLRCNRYNSRLRKEGFSKIFMIKLTPAQEAANKVHRQRPLTTLQTCVLTQRELLLALYLSGPWYLDRRLTLQDRLGEGYEGSW